MSSIIRVSDIGRPGILVYMPSPAAALTLDFIFQAIAPTPERSTTNTTYTTVDSGSFGIPSTAWTYSSRDVDYLFFAHYELRSSASTTTAFGRAIIDGATLPEASTTSTTYQSFNRAIIKRPSSLNISWRFELRSSVSGSAVNGRHLRIFYCPVWTNNVLFSKDIGANVLLLRATLPVENTGLRIDDDYWYRNPGSSPVTLSFNLLPFHKIEFFGSPWVKIEYLRVE
jgi:hypothetical protein